MEREEKKMTFEAEFPSLKGLASDEHITNRPDGIRKLTKVFCQIDIQEKCLDKQRVKEAIEKIGRKRISEGNFEDCFCEEDLKKELF